MNFHHYLQDKGCKFGDMNCDCQTVCRCPVDRRTCDLCSQNICCHLQGQDTCNCCLMIAAAIPSDASRVSISTALQDESKIRNESPFRNDRLTLEENFNAEKEKWGKDCRHFLDPDTNFSISSNEEKCKTKIFQNPEIRVQKVTSSTPIIPCTVLTQENDQEIFNKCLQDNQEKNKSAVEFVSNILSSNESKDKGLSLPETSTSVCAESAYIKTFPSLRHHSKEFLENSKKNHNGINTTQLPKFKNIQKRTIQQEFGTLSSSQTESRSFIGFRIAAVSSVGNLPLHSAPDGDANSALQGLEKMVTKYCPSRSSKDKLKKREECAVKPSDTTSEKETNNARHRKYSRFPSITTKECVSVLKNTPTLLPVQPRFVHQPLGGFFSFQPTCFPDYSRFPCHTFMQPVNPCLVATNRPSVSAEALTKWSSPFECEIYFGFGPARKSSSGALRRKMHGRFAGGKKGASEECFRKSSFGKKDLMLRGKLDDGNMTCALKLDEKNSTAVKQSENIQPEESILSRREILSSDNLLPMVAEATTKETQWDLIEESLTTRYYVRRKKSKRTVDDRSQ